MNGELRRLRDALGRHLAEGRVVLGRQRKQPAPTPVAATGTVSDLIDDLRR